MPAFSYRRFAVTGAVIAICVLVGTSSVYAETAPKDVVLVSCSPNASVAKDNTFATKLGDVVVFKCKLTNRGNTKADVLLSGERVRENPSNLTAKTFGDALVSIPSNSTVEENVPFVTLFEIGTYHYTIILKNLSDGKPFGSPLNFTSTLNDVETIRIVSVTLNKKAYAPGDMVSFVAAVATSSQGTRSGKTTPFFLDAVVKGKDGKACRYVVSDRPITTAKGPIFFSLSAVPNDCSIAVLGVIMKTKNGFPQDSRDIPLIVRAPSLFANSITMQIALVLLVAVVVLIALAIRRFRRTQNTTP